MPDGAADHSTVLRPCQVCGAEVETTTQYVRDRVRCRDCFGVHTGWDGSTLVHPTTRYRDDVAAQLFVDHFPRGATLEQVGLAFGVTRERIRQIEAGALIKLRAGLAAAGVTADHLSARVGGEDWDTWQSPYVWGRTAWK